MTDPASDQNVYRLEDHPKMELFFIGCSATLAIVFLNPAWGSHGGRDPAWYYYLATYLSIFLLRRFLYSRPRQTLQRMAELLTLAISGLLVSLLQGVPASFYFFMVSAFTFSLMVFGRLFGTRHALASEKPSEPPSGDRCRLSVVDLMVGTAVVAVFFRASFSLDLSPYEMSETLIMTVAMAFFGTAMLLAFNADHFRAFWATIAFTAIVAALAMVTVIRYTEPNQFAFGLYGKGGFLLIRYWLVDFAIMQLFLIPTVIFSILAASFAQEEQLKKSRLRAFQAAIQQVSKRSRRAVA